MTKMTLEDLRKLRDEKIKEFSKRETDGKDIEIIIGMGTCGIAAGAKETMSAFIEILDEKGLKNVVVKQTGCMGSCKYEPTVEIKVPGMPSVIYQKVTKDVVSHVVNEHLINKKLVNDLVQDRPSIDITKIK